MVHFVIIVYIPKIFQVQNKPMGFLPPIQMKGPIAMKLIHTEYNPMHNSIDINHYNGYILQIDCNQAESGIRTTPNSQQCLNALAIANPLEYARLALDASMGRIRRIVWKCFKELIPSQMARGDYHFSTCFTLLFQFQLQLVAQLLFESVYRNLHSPRASK